MNISIWLWLLIFFSPNVSMTGYLINAKVGAITYNIFHHIGIAIVFMTIGYFMKTEVLLSIGILFFTHASFDRMMAYRLKYYSSFNDTHLGKIKNEKNLTA